MTEGIWTLEGTSLAEAAQSLQNREAKDGVGETMQQLLAVVQRYPEGIKAKEAADILDWERKKVDTYLSRALESQRVERKQRGVYTPVGSEGNVGNPQGEGLLPSHPSLPTPSAGPCSKFDCTRPAAAHHEWCDHHIQLNTRLHAVLSGKDSAA